MSFLSFSEYPLSSVHIFWAWWDDCSLRFVAYSLISSSVIGASSSSREKVYPVEVAIDFPESRKTQTSVGSFHDFFSNSWHDWRKFRSKTRGWKVRSSGPKKLLTQCSIWGFLFLNESSTKFKYSINGSLLLPASWLSPRRLV